MTHSLGETLQQLPAEPTDSLLESIRHGLADANRKIVVLDDDPTGTQTVHDTPVLTHWSVDVLSEEFRRDGSLFYLLTNSRALPADQANALAQEIGQNLMQASRQTSRDFTVVSRSDSTLRGHYPGEVTALADAIGQRDAVHVIHPFFLQGGRYTIENVHYVAEGDKLVPAGETPFAQDATFGFDHSNLVDWVIEKHGGSLQRSQVHSVTLDELRCSDPLSVGKRLAELPAGDVCVVNSVSMRDVQAFVVAALSAEKAGKRFLYRTAASFVQAFAGLEAKGPLAPQDMVNPSAQAGLIVVGSYVPKTTAQLQRLLDSVGPEELAPVVLDVQELLGSEAEGHLVQKLTEVNDHLAAGRNVVLHTSRKLVTGQDGTESLGIGTRVSEAVVKMVRGVEQPLRFLVAKGGITSSDVATKGLDVRRAIVLGQILPGIPVWRLQDESRLPGLAYVVFPGNVGDDQALLNAYQKLK